MPKIGIGGRGAFIFQKVLPPSKDDKSPSAAWTSEGTRCRGDKKVHVWKLVFIMKQLMVRIVFSYQIYQFWKLYGTDGIGKDARDHTYPSGTTPRCHV